MQDPMDIDFSSVNEDGMIMEVDKTERNHGDFSSADEDKMVQELKRVEKGNISVIYMIMFSCKNVF